MPPWTPDPGQFPRFRLLDGPSPLHVLPRFSAALGGKVEVWIKREDLLPLAFGGNKLRNLEFLVGAALAEGADTLVTSGRRWSNHARLTAAAGVVAGLPVHLVLSGPRRDPPGPAIVISRLLGATVHQAVTADRAEREAFVDRVADDLRQAGRRPYVIGVGGGSVAGLIGQVLAARELTDAALDQHVAIDAAVVPSATGGTQAGLLAGFATTDARLHVRGVAVSLPPADLGARIQSMLGDLAEVPGLPSVPATAIDIVEDQLGQAYGAPTMAATEAARLLATTEGILVDPIYGAKGLAGLIALARSGALDGQRVAFWHTGGTPGLFETLDDLAAG